jgi:hypothetical protein
MMARVKLLARIVIDVCIEPTSKTSVYLLDTRRHLDFCGRYLYVYGQSVVPFLMAGSTALKSRNRFGVKLQPIFWLAFASSDTSCLRFRGFELG